MKSILAVSCFMACCQWSHQGVISLATSSFLKIVAEVDTAVEETTLDVANLACPEIKTLLRLNYDDLKDTDLSSLTIWAKTENKTTIYNVTAASILTARAASPNETLMIFVHGFNDSPSSENFQDIANASLKAGLVMTIFALDSNTYIGDQYVRSSTLASVIGEYLGDTLADMVDDGLSVSLIHLIGHSLGVHICGRAGERFHNRTGVKIPRISGLDPAGPCFEGEVPSLTLDDADFVDIVHTDSGALGIDVDIGHVDYLPNNGTRIQPGCTVPDINCSHGRSVKFYAESMTNPTGFLAVSCRDWATFEEGQCGTITSYMGYPATSTSSGRYYLRTGSESPFGLGEQSIVPAS